MRLSSVLLVYTEALTEEEGKTQQEVRDVLRERSIAIRTADKNSLRASDFSNKDLIITVGGDGTFLAAAHHAINGTPLLGVNANPKKKEGFMLSATRATFANALLRIIDGKAAVHQLETLEAWINDKPLPIHAVNEFYIGSSKSYLMSRYEVRIDRKKETHRSSGILVTTPIGSHAWASAVCGVQLRIPKQRAAYLVREPYQRRVFANYQVKRGLLKHNQKISITSKMRDGVVVADSLSTEYPFKYDDTVKVGLSRKTITVIKPS